MRPTLGIEHHNIRTLGQLVIKKARFDGKERFGILVVVDEQMHEMLPHPLFGREHDVFAANQVVNVRFPVQVFNFVRKGRQIQRFQVVSGQLTVDNGQFLFLQAFGALLRCV